MNVVVRLAETVDAPPAPGRTESRSATSDDGRRWIAVGRSTERDSHAAGREAASAALAAADPKLLVVFCSEQHELRRLVAGIRDQAEDAALIGCTTAGEIAADGPGDGGVIVAALGGPGFNVRTAAGPVGEDGLRSAGAAAAGRLRELPESRHQALMLLAQGVGGDTQEIVRGVHQIVGAAIPLVGGCAGDGMTMEQTFQLHDDQVLTDGVVAAAIGSDAPIGIGWRHGWERVGEPMLVTRCSENRVVEIDDRPALDEYLDRLDAPGQVRSDAGEFTRWARTHPLGLGRRRSGQEPVRCVNEAGFEDRTLGCTAAVPEGGMAWFMHGDADSLLRSAEGSCEDALEALGGRPPIGLFAFDCIGRRGVLGEDGIRTEVARIEAVGSAPVAGLYTYGEIARRRGVNAVHSQTLVSLAFA